MAEYGNIESVLLRADTYRTAYRRMSFIALCMGGVAAISVLVAAAMVMSRPEPRYFAATTDGRIVPLVPLDRPNLTPNRVVNLATEAVTRVLTFSFDRYRQDFQDAMRFFTQPAGWNSFVGAIEKSGTLDLVKNKRLNTTAVAQNAVIVRQGPNANGVYEWVVQIPVRVTYQSASEVTGQNLMVTVTLQQLQSYENENGAAISQFIAAPGS